jgi:GNAT superfamily N-acetyltransferase
VAIRPAAAADGEALRALERAAGERFREIGMDAVADDEPLSLEALAGSAEAGRAWVALGEGGGGEGRPVGYVLVEVVDGCAHVAQVSVHPDHQGRGVGRALLDHVTTWAAGKGLPAVTLTTFRDVAWNAPLYRHLGFVDLDEAAWGPELRALVAAEAGHGLDPATRTCMRRAVPRSPA